MQNLFIALGVWFVVALVVSIGLGFFLQAVRHLAKKPGTNETIGIRRGRESGSVRR